MNKTTAGGVLILIGGSIVGLVILIGGLMFAFPAYNRYQSRANARNQVKVSAIQIRNQAQRVKIAQQHAQIRYQTSIGIREAQDEIARTLTPLYVQFEMVQALQAIAQSGRNNSVVYIPAGANGVPLVATTSRQEVTLPNGGK